MAKFTKTIEPLTWKMEIDGKPLREIVRTEVIAVKGKSMKESVTSDKKAETDAKTMIGAYQAIGRLLTKQRAAEQRLFSKTVEGEWRSLVISVFRL